MTDNDLNGLLDKINLYGEDVKRPFTRERLIYDQDLHLKIARLSGNTTLARTLSQVFERIIRKRRTDGLYDPSRGASAHREHRQLYGAMKERDITQAVAVIRAHIRAGKDDVMVDLKQRQEFREPYNTRIVNN